MIAPGTTALPDAVTPFTFPVTGQTVRAVMIDGKPMFATSEVATVLGYARPSKAVQDRCKYPKLFKGTDSVPLTSSPRGINMIPESDVYRLIIRSKLPAAEQFEEWVMETVLPAIRQDRVSPKCPAPTLKKTFVGAKVGEVQEIFPTPCFGKQFQQ